jgi:hypothetical protein
VGGRLGPGPARGRRRREPGHPFWALGEVLKAQAGILEFDDPATVAAKLAGTVAAVVEEPAERQWLETRLAPLLGLASDMEARTGTPEQAETFTAWRRFLEAVAARRPLVLVLEDLHWADDALLAFVRHLAEEARSVPLLVVARPGPSCSTATRTGARARPAGPRPSPSPPCRTPTPPA